MKITCLYLHVSAKSDPAAPDPSYYLPYSLRFARTFEEHPAGVDHELIVVSCGKPIGEDQMYLYRNITDRYECYEGPGWDLGAYQAIAKTLDSDWVVCLATPVHIKREGWLKRFADVFTEYGDGLYGAMGSYENHPHIRTSSFAFKPEIMRQYPHLIDSREKCFGFECGCDSKGNLLAGHHSWCFTDWMIGQGKPVLMVTWDMVWPKDKWRVPPNIFRRGDQSNCLVQDRHNDIYQASDANVKAMLENLADIPKYP